MRSRVWMTNAVSGMAVAVALAWPVDARAQALPEMPAAPDFRPAAPQHLVPRAGFQHDTQEAALLAQLGAERATLGSAVQAIQEQMHRLQMEWQAAAQRYRALESDFRQTQMQLMHLQQQLSSLHPYDPRRGPLSEQARLLQQRLGFLQHQGQRVQEYGLRIEAQAAGLNQKLGPLIQQLEAVSARLIRVQYAAATELQRRYFADAPIQDVSGSVAHLLGIAGSDPRAMAEELSHVSGVSPEVSHQIRSRLPQLAEAFNQGRLSSQALDVGLAELYERGLVSGAQQAALQRLSQVQSPADVGRVLLSADGVTSLAQLFQRFLR